MSRRLDLMMQELKNTNAETFFHSLRTKKLVLEMIEKTNSHGLTDYSSEEIDCICKGALLHDIGKLQVDNFILTKETYLTPEEKEQVQEHVEYGYNIVKNELEQSELKIVTDICRYHHERCDGSGYTGMTDLPMYVNIVAICDAFDSLYSDRIYRDGFSAEKSMELIENSACGGFDEKLVKFMGEIARNLD
ncbi:MAG: HD domain-containing protein [Clostridia bacterium]|nr:HD domain-containing protein [Clostridia bacterium]